VLLSGIGLSIPRHPELMIIKLCFLIAVLFQAASGAEVVEEKFPSGKLKSRHEMAPGRGGMVNHGQSIEFYENGQEKMRLRYVKGILDGPAVEHHHNGQVKREVTYAAGVPHGLDVTYHANGQKASETTYRQGQKHGTRVAWSGTGNKVLHEEYEQERRGKATASRCW
jgi:antitoxin component YwqK of YwqJK toxin-antitoxin module